MKAVKSLLFLAGIFFLPSLASAQTIAQDEFLNLLIESHPIFEKEQLTAQIEREEQASYLGSEDLLIHYGANLMHETPALAIGPERTTALSAQGGIQRIFWNTGARLSASASVGGASLKIDPMWGFPDFIYQNQVEISYSHPLKRNKGGFLDRFPYELKNFDIDFSEVQALENLENFLADAATRFLDWVFLGEQKRIVAERLRLSEEELARIRRRREANLVDEVDVLRAEDVVRIWRQNQVLVESQWRALQAELAVLSQNEEMYDLSPQYDLYEITELPPLEDTIAQLNENIRLLRLLRVRIDQSQFARRQFEEMLKPDLSLIAYFNTKEMDDNVAKALLMDKPDLTVGLQFNYPLQNRTAKSQIDRTDAQVLQLEHQTANIRLKLASTLTNLHIQMSELRNVLDLNVEQIASAERRTQEELRLYNQGRGNLTFVIQSQDNEQNARLTYAGNAAVYHQLMVQYRNLLDQIYSR